jgi:hypothetical protein
MTRSVLFLVLSAFVVVSSSHDNFVVQAKKTTTISCSCTTKSAAAGGSSHKVVTKTAECQSGASYAAKNKCCAKAAKPSQRCKYHPAEAPAAGTPSPNSLLGSNAPSKDCYEPGCAAKPEYGPFECEGRTGDDCNTDAGSICIYVSGGLVHDPRCTCNTDADCPQPTSLWVDTNRNKRYKCEQWKPTASRTYKGKVCQLKKL